MPAWLKNPLGVPILIVLAIVALCLLLGMSIPVFTTLVGEEAGRLIALPAVLLLGVLLIYDYKKLLMAILLFRSMGDIVLDSTQIGSGGVSMGLGGVINLIVIMSACMMVLEKPRLFPTRLASYWLPLLLMMAFSLSISLEKGNSTKDYLGMLSNFSMFIIAIYLVRSNEDFNKIIRLVVWSSVIPTVVSIVRVVQVMRDSTFRLYSTFTHPNILAFYLTLVLVLCLYMLKSRLFTITPKGRMAVLCYMPMLLGQLMLTQTRSAWVAFFVVFMLYALLFERKYLLYLLLVPLAVVFIPSVSERFTELGQGNDAVNYARLNSFAWRVLLWKSAISWMEPLRLVYGYGLGGFNHYATDFFELAGTMKWDAHNVYVQFLFDMGMIGLLCYVSLYVRVLFVLRALARIDRVSGFLMLSIVVQYMIVSASDNTFRYLVFNWYLWFIIGGACSLVSLHAQAKSAADGIAAMHGGMTIAGAGMKGRV